MRWDRRKKFALAPCSAGLSLSRSRSRPLPAPTRLFFFSLSSPQHACARASVRPVPRSAPTQRAHTPRASPPSVPPPHPNRRPPACDRKKMDPPRSVTVAVIGDAGVGKTCLITAAHIPASGRRLPVVLADPILLDAGNDGDGGRAGLAGV